MHADGNDGENAEVKPSYPTPIYLGGGQQIDAPDAGSSVGVHRLYHDQTVFGRVQ